LFAKTLLAINILVAEKINELRGRLRGFFIEEIVTRGRGKGERGRWGKD
jgi:hypothetical protein